MSSQVDTQSTVERLLGRVKWFNNKAGYGFITVTDGSRSGSDVFVHHSSIGVSSEQYKYLVQGEYVEFEVVATQGGAHEFQAHNITGIKGGKLMCETRREFKIARSNYKTTSQSSAEGHQTEEAVVSSRQPRAPRLHGEGPKSAANQEDGKGWNLVGKTRQSTKPVSGRGRGRPPRSSSVEATK